MLVVKRQFYCSTFHSGEEIPVLSMLPYNWFVEVRTKIPQMSWILIDS